MSSSRQELWYDAEAARVPKSALSMAMLTAGLTISSVELPPDAGAYWLTSCSARLQNAGSVGTTSDELS